MWIEREIAHLVAEQAGLRPAVVVTGCRQAGKTSLLEHLFPSHGFTSLDVPAVAAEAENSGEQFLAKLGSPAIIDEIQYAPALLRHIKRAIDKRRDAAGLYLLTGSQGFSLMQGVTESLAGRAAILVCHSLSALEVEQAFGQGIEGQRLLDFMVQGGYPELQARHLSPARFYGDYVATYLERDVRQVLQVRSLRDFDRFMRLLALRTGQLVSAHALAGDLGVSSPTIKSWLSVLVASNIVMLVEPFYRNLGKRLVKTPKLYFSDTGLACYLAGIESGKELAQSAMLGAMFETHVAGQLARLFANKGLRKPFYFYRDHHGNEVDFIIARAEKLQLIECKWAESPKASHKGFDEVSRLATEDNILSRTVVCSRRGSYQAKTGVVVADSIDMSHLL